MAGTAALRPRPDRRLRRPCSTGCDRGRIATSMSAAPSDGHGKLRRPLVVTEEDAPMLARRALAALTALLAAASVAGCAKTISGRGSLAVDAVQPGGSPGSTESPSGSAGGSRSAEP